jgi:cyclopropane-fatty-acyl-phospholipid synthase
VTLRQRAARALAHRVLARVRHAELVVREGEREWRFGEPGAVRRAELRVHSPAFYPALLRGSTGLAESYMDGLWESEDLVALTRVGAVNMPPLDALRRGLRPLWGPVQAVAGWIVRNTPARSRRRIAAHYDLGNDLFELMLDETLMYSCAHYPVPDATLREAQLHKLETICRDLDLQPEDHLLEIGTGWGALAVHAAARYGCRVTTTTISREQHALAVERVRAAALEDRVTVVLRDYRELEGRYDKLVSIEMIEAVGWLHFDTFFRRCGELLRPGGAMLLQAITIDDRAFEVEKATRSFIRTYVFPGGCLPSKRVMERSIARVTDLRPLAARDLTVHYPPTLSAWRRRFDAGAARLDRLGYDARFRRLWRLYLSYCEGGFRERRIEVGQFLFARPGVRATAGRGDVLDSVAA